MHLKTSRFLLLISVTLWIIVFPHIRGALLTAVSSPLICLVCLFVRFSFTKLHLLMRLRWGPSPASCSVSGIRSPACRHAFTPGVKRRQRRERKGDKKKIKATANYVDLKESDKATAMRGWQNSCLFLSQWVERLAKLPLLTEKDARSAVALMM